MPVTGPSHPGSEGASREADELAASRELRDLGGRVKAARAAVAKTPGAADKMRADWRKEASFLARFAISRAQFRQGAGEIEVGSRDSGEWVDPQSDELAERHARGTAELP